MKYLFLISMGFTCLAYNYVVGIKMELHLNDGVAAIFDSIEKKMAYQSEHFKKSFLSEANLGTSSRCRRSVSDEETRVLGLTKDIDVLKTAIVQFNERKVAMRNKIMNYLEQRSTLTAQEYNEVHEVSLEINQGIERIRRNVDFLDQVLSDIYFSSGKVVEVTELPFDPDLAPPENISVFRTSPTEMRATWSIQYPIVRGYRFYFIRRDHQHLHLNHWRSFAILNHSKRVDVDGISRDFAYAVRMRAVSLDGLNGVLSETFYIKQYDG